MKAIILLGFLIFLFFGFEANSTENQSVNESFTRYVQSILNDNGDAAYSLVDKNTRDYYDRLSVLSRTAAKENIEKLGIIDKMQVFIMRHKIPHEQLSKMSGKELFIYSVNNGLVGKNSVLGLNIGDITINDKFAKAEVIVNGQKTPLNYHFYNENNNWKLDITEMTKWGEAAMLQQLQQSGMQEDEFIFYLLQLVSGTKVDESTIWKPVN
ncbi:MAG: hypothetical protein ACRENO_09325 [Thermodesulfobacteriota bacterium]